MSASQKSYPIRVLRLFSHMHSDLSSSSRTRVQYVYGSIFSHTSSIYAIIQVSPRPVCTKFPDYEKHQLEIHPTICSQFRWCLGVIYQTAKRHLFKTCQGHLLNFEELSTLFCQIEACINSRPLIPLSNDPADLTPGHFLIGEPLLELNEGTNLTNQNLSLSFRWKSLLQLKHEFWSRWTRDVLHHLQARRKWHQHRPPLSVGDLVLIQTDNMPKLSWLLRTPSEPAKRAINRLSALPVPTCHAPEDGDSPERQQMAQ
ncbi:hypothetical protein HNY73_006222 [Argiope bruennichi]|uniref:DUF5641 domain-containing protein n=1 Tax=Argiope bruennichi TaxID=94029 RepID=A0A8T0FLS2_ARGBR|nr:hypothetical protein HNY73_006222 [Argiope bruennichi]